MKIVNFIVTSLMLIILYGCATPMKSIKKTHSGEMNKVFAKYKSVFNQHDWEITQSDSNGGFLKAVKPFQSLGMVIGIFSSTISCTNDTTVSCLVKIDECKNTVPLSGCSPISEYRVKNEMQDFVNDLEKIN